MSIVCEATDNDVRRSIRRGQAKYKAQIDKDLDEGRKAGINGTPAFFINGVALSGAQGQDSFIRAIPTRN